MFPFPPRNELERQYLCLLRFHLYVSDSVYAQYYFDLRSLARNHGLPIVPAPLQKERGKAVDSQSGVCCQTRKPVSVDKSYYVVLRK